MKTRIAILLAIPMILLACATAPTATQVQAIQNACAVDVGMRPIVAEVLAVSGLAQPPEIAGLAAAHQVIDTICANPSASAQANAIASLTRASAQIIGIVTTLKARQAGLPAAKPVAK
jgi:hypothetical protein